MSRAAPGGPETPADLAERLVPVAADLVIRVHDEGPESVGQLLAGLTERERWALLVVLAAMAPPDAAVADLLAWVAWDEHGRRGGPEPRPPSARFRALRPCGTHAAYVRHKSRGETPCQACADAERAYQRARPRRRRPAA